MNTFARRVRSGLVAPVQIAASVALLGGTIAAAPTLAARADRADRAEHAVRTEHAVPPRWEVGPGSKVPTPLMATAVHGRMPTFREQGMTYVIAFASFDHSPSREAIPVLNGLQTELGKQVSIVAITDQGAAEAKKFVESADWGKQITFPVAADPQRSAFRAFFGPQIAPDLPVAFVVRDGLVQWAGHPSELAGPVASVVRGGWDVAAAARVAEQRAMWKGILESVEKLAADGKFDEAIKFLDDACGSAMGDQGRECLGVRFSLLLRAGRTPEALQVGEQILAKPLNAKQPAGLAWTLIGYAPNDAAAKAFALKAALASDAAVNGRDPMVAAILARVQFANGHRTEAIESARRGLSLATSPDLVAAIREDIRRYEGAGAPDA